MSMIIKALTSFCSPGGKNGRLSILIFHRVLPQPDPVLNWDLHARDFSDILSWMSKWFNVLPLDQAIRMLKSGTLPSRAAAITFDDGYEDNLTVAAPILVNHGMTATFFVASGYLNGGQMWNDTIIESVRQCSKNRLDLSDEGLGVYDLSGPESIRNAIVSILKVVKYRSFDDRIRLSKFVKISANVHLHQDLMLTSQQVVELRDLGMHIGSHTVNHPILSTLSADQVIEEILDNKNFLECLLQEKIGLFAYPNGKPNIDYRFSDTEILRKLGFDAAFTTAWGVADTFSDLMQLPRFTPWDRNPFGFAFRMNKNLRHNSLLRANQLAA